MAAALSQMLSTHHVINNNNNNNNNPTDQSRLLLFLYRLCLLPECESIISFSSTSNRQKYKSKNTLRNASPDSTSVTHSQLTARVPEALSKHAIPANQAQVTFSGEEVDSLSAERPRWLILTHGIGINTFAPVSTSTHHALLPWQAWPHGAPYPQCPEKVKME